MGDPRIDTPGLLGTLYGNPDFDWDYMTVPQVPDAFPLSFTRVVLNGK